LDLGVKEISQMSRFEVASFGCEVRMDLSATHIDRDLGVKKSAMHTKEAFCMRATLESQDVKGSGCSQPAWKMPGLCGSPTQRDLFKAQFIQRHSAIPPIYFN